MPDLESSAKKAREAAPQPRWRRLAPWALAAGAALVGVGLGFFVSGEETPAPNEPAFVGYPIIQSPGEVGVPLEDAGCGPVQEPEIQRNRVVAPETEHPPYSSTPPTSGPRYITPAPAAVYFQAHDPELMVANMAEGGVVVWHRGLAFRLGDPIPPSVEKLRAELTALLALFKSEQILAVGGDDLGLDHEIVLTAWGKLQECERFSGEAIADFFEKYQGGGPGLPGA